MKKYLLLFCSATCVFTLAAYCLFTGSEWLDVTWHGPITLWLGNIITWAGLVAYSLMAFAVLSLCHQPIKSVLRSITQITLIVACLWYPLSIWMAGNLALNFSGGLPWHLYWGLNYALLLVPTMCLLAGLVLELHKRWRHKH